MITQYYTPTKVLFGKGAYLEAGRLLDSLDYDSFDDIILPAYNSCEGTYGDLWSHNPALDLEFRRFSSDSWVEFQKMQIDIL